MENSNLFDLIGGQTYGLKVRDLIDHRELLEKVGFRVLGGQNITVEVFQRFLLENNFNESTLPEVILTAKPTEEIKNINLTLLQSMSSGVPYAIRSDSLADCGGIGIYESTVFVPEGNSQDVEKLWECQRRVYASEFYPAAHVWRQDNNLPIGMAIIIQPFLGQKGYKNFRPRRSGRAYNSLYGRTTVKAVAGLATEQSLSSVSPIIWIPEEGGFLKHRIPSQSQVLEINQSNGEVVQTEISPNEWNQLQEEYCDDIFLKMHALRLYGNFYLEWVQVNESDEYIIVQCAKLERPLIEPINDDYDGKTLLFESNQIVNHGKKICQYLIYLPLGRWIINGLNCLEAINQKYAKFILVVPTHAFARTANMRDPRATLPEVFSEEDKVDRKLNLQYFSHASVLVENLDVSDFSSELNMKILGINQAFHSLDNDACLHFQQLCDRQNILFMGIGMSPDHLYGLLGEPYIQDENVLIWKAPFEIINDQTTSIGKLYLCQ
ncbi:MAG: hypothetical protein WCV58_04495 [Patescibacteria group bacterium]